MEECMLTLSLSLLLCYAPAPQQDEWTVWQKGNVVYIIGTIKVPENHKAYLFRIPPRIVESDRLRFNLVFDRTGKKGYRWGNLKYAIPTSGLYEEVLINYPDRKKWKLIKIKKH
jgi:hypothetical protein